MTTDPNHRPELAEQILQAFAAQGKRIDEIPEEDPARIAAEQLSDAFTQGVAYLTISHNQNIRELSTLLWDLVGSYIVPVGIGPDVDSLTLAVVNANGASQATIFTPYHWLDMIADDGICQLGALVFIGSQARDFYNKRLDKNTLQRSHAYEAEFLLSIKEINARHLFNEGQIEVMSSYPQGIRSEKARGLMYTSKPFVAPS